jgi:hypothetical protein
MQRPFPYGQRCSLVCNGYVTAVVVGGYHKPQIKGGGICVVVVSGQTQKINAAKFSQDKKTPPKTKYFSTGNFFT